MVDGVLLICGLWLFVACSKDDVPVVEKQLQDGEWTGSGEGRSGTIIVRVTVESHQVTEVTVVSQSDRALRRRRSTPSVRVPWAERQR